MDRPAFDQMSIGASVRVAAHGFRKESWPRDDSSGSTGRICSQDVWNIVDPS